MSNLGHVMNANILVSSPDNDVTAETILETSGLADVHSFYDNGSHDDVLLFSTGFEDHIDPRSFADDLMEAARSLGATLTGHLTGVYEGTDGLLVSIFTGDTVVNETATSATVFVNGNPVVVDL